MSHNPHLTSIHDLLKLMSAQSELLRRKIKEIERQLRYDLEMVIDPILNKHSGSDSLGLVHHPIVLCAHDGMRVLTHMKALKNLGVWPPSIICKDRSIAATCAILATYVAAPISGCPCLEQRPNFEQMVRKAGSKALQSFDGLCLHCVRLGVTQSGVSGRCPFHELVESGRTGTR